MGIESTQFITRQYAIDRITDILELVKEENYAKIEDCCFEEKSTKELFEFVEIYKSMDISKLNKLTDAMLEEIMDIQFFRFSMFENYIIKQ